MDYYRQFKSEKTDCIYSLDMVRINFDLGNNLQTFNAYLQKVSDFDLRFDIAYYPSYKAFKYRHLWSIKDVITEYSWSVGLDLGKNSDDKRKGYIEFNPNKCMNSELFLEFWETFTLYAVTRDLVRFDCAIDIPIGREQIRLMRNKGRLYQMICNDDGLTEYLGRRSNNGFIKLYDKTCESKLDYTLSRLELTCDLKCDIDSIFPIVHVFDKQLNLDVEMSDLSERDKVTISLLRQSDLATYYINRFNYRYRKKIEPYLADKVLSLDKKCYLSVRETALSFCL